MQRFGRPSLLLTAIAWLGLLYLILPVAIVAVMSLSASRYLAFPPPGWSTEWYFKFFGDPVWIDATLNSFRLGERRVCATRHPRRTAWCVPVSGPPGDPPFSSLQWSCGHRVGDRCTAFSGFGRWFEYSGGARCVGRAAGYVSAGKPAPGDSRSTRGGKPWRRPAGFSHGRISCLGWFPERHSRSSPRSTSW
jgi:hypothetical protein